MNVELPETLVIIVSIVYKSNGFAISFPSLADRTHRSTIEPMVRQLSKSDSAMVALVR